MAQILVIAGIVLAVRMVQAQYWRGNLNAAVSVG